jgi:hypothetical protein
MCDFGEMNLLSHTSGSTLFFHCKVTDESGNERVYMKVNNTGYALYQSWGCYPRNLNSVQTASWTVGSGDLPVIRDTDKSYEIWGSNSGIPAGGGERTETKTFKIKKDCHYITPTTIMFLDRHGALGSYTFTRAKRETRKIKRASYRKNFGNFSNNTFSYNLSDRGKTTLFSSVDKSFTVTSNWVSEETAVHIEELIESPSCYLVDGNNLIAVNVTTESHVVKDGELDELMNFTIGFEYSNKDSYIRSITQI